jgi:L-threonylcarbamoyladenylate synthase
VGGEVERAIEALGCGEPVLLPADGVYGLCAAAESEAPVRRMYEVKGRDEGRPTAVIAASIDVLLDRVPELRGREEAIVRALLPGPYTLVLPNPAGRYPWLTGERPDTIGVRVARLPRQAQQVLDAVGTVVATSANDPGEPSPASLEAVPARIRKACGAEIDAGPLSGEASTVIDFTSPEPVVIREGAGPVADALERARDALDAPRVA